MTLLDNPNVTAEEPLVIDAYGTGDKPWLQVPNLKASAFLFGGYNNTSYDGGYTLRNLKIDGMGTTDWGFFLVHNLHHVTLENNEITGFHIGIHSQSRGPKGVTHIVIRNNSISRNRGMGILGSFNDTLIEGNLFEANNFSGSGFDHGTYLSGTDPHGGRNVTLRNNRYIRNSVVNGVCKGGNMTFHGQMDGVLIEGNTIEQDSAAPTCWLMSITQGLRHGRVVSQLRRAQQQADQRWQQRLGGAIGAWHRGRGQRRHQHPADRPDRPDSGWRAVPGR